MENSKSENGLGLTPLLVFQGKEDLICTAERTIEFFDGLNTKQKELILLDSKFLKNIYII
jgi:dipeptidyl aminopeptidase/acylaminoacyl peptidase